MNRALLVKWLWKLENESGTWVNIMKSKYIQNKCLSGLEKKPGDSQFWCSLMEVKKLYFQHVTKKIGDENAIRFWEDWWVGSRPLKDMYPRLYNISFDHNISMAEAVNKGWQGFSFRRDLNAETSELWNSLKQRCEVVRMHGGADQPMWMLTKNRKFSVKSLYSFLINDGVGFPHKFLWKTKIPSKIKMFLWPVTRRSILTKDNLLRKGWKGAKECVYCGKTETIDHLFFDCSAARLVWTLIKCAFDLRRNPISLMISWGGGGGG